MARLTDSAGKLLTSSGPALTPFQDGELIDIAAAVGANYGEPTALLSDDGTQIDFWFTYDNKHPAYGYSTNGADFTGFVDTDIPNGFLRPHILKNGSTYYLYAVHGGDASMHLFAGTDKIHFTDQGEVMGLGGGWDVGHIANMFVWVEDGAWYMLYEGNAGTGETSHIGLATAPAAAGPWTRYGSGPVITGTETAISNGIGNPELPRLGSTVIKRGGKYYCYFHGTTTGCDGPQGRAWSTDLHTWTVEGAIGGVRFDHQPVWNGASGWTYGDQCLVQFGGKTYLFWSPSNQVNSSHIDGAVDNRTELELLGAPPAGAYAATKVLTNGL